MNGHDGKCIYCEHGPYCTRCAPPGSVPDDAYVCGPCREALVILDRFIPAMRDALGKIGGGAAYAARK